MMDLSSSQETFFFSSSTFELLSFSLRLSFIIAAEEPTATSLTSSSSDLLASRELSS